MGWRFNHSLSRLFEQARREINLNLEIDDTRLPYP
jgi:hypothetical protein